MSSLQNPQKALASTRRRHRAELRFRVYGLAAIGFAVAVLILLISSIATEAVSAFSKHRVTLTVKLDESVLTPDGDRDPDRISQNVGGFHEIVRAALEKEFPEALNTRESRLEMSQVVTRLATRPMAMEIAQTPGRIGRTKTVTLPVSDDLDLYLKGLMSREESRPVSALLPDPSAPDSALTGEFDDLVSTLNTHFEAIANRYERQRVLPAERRMTRLLNQQSENTTAADPALEREIEAVSTSITTFRQTLDTLRAKANEQALDLSPTDVSVLIEGPEGVFKVQQASLEQVSGIWLTRTEADRAPSVRLVFQPEADRTISDQQIAWIRTLEANGAIKQSFNHELFVNSDSNYAEIAGTLAAMAGSILTMLVTMLLAVPIGVMTAIYLEEFAPKTGFTDLIEVNINNLAAVPSIVFGLLGAALFINGIGITLPFTDISFTLGGGLSRGWPLVGGMVLALMTLPTVIIASRAALGAVPGSVREAALGLGASKMQTVFHHVVPAAAPGILTGSIIGLAQALGETAPLLLIGMFAFVAEAPNSPTDPSTALPVLIFKWANNAERAWEPMTSAAIIILLVVMVTMNALAVFLRRRFERKS